MTVDSYIDSMILGDCLEVMPEMPGHCVDLVVTSPPYNCRKDYGGSPDEIPWDLYYQFLGAFLDQAYRVLVTGGTLAINMPLVVRWQRDHRYAGSWATYDQAYRTHRGAEKVNGKGRVEPLGINCFNMMLARDMHVREPIVWVKGKNGEPMSKCYQMGCDSDPYMRPTHEHILLGSKGRWFHRGGTGRRGAEAIPFSDLTKDVWFIPAVSSSEHPAPFPVEIPRRLIRLFTHADDAIVLDPFAGRGTTLEAAIQMGRRYIGIDTSPAYCDIAERRIADARKRLGKGEA